MTKNWMVYLVECADATLYCGVTTDMEQRLLKHNQGTASKYTRGRRPVRLVAQCPHLTRSQALKLEYQIKQLPAGRKIETLLHKAKANECPDHTP
ncbi:MAG: GIY-YIG nuclease family protein [Desulfobacterales bacterium]|nr:GIY-YIG nuclease family protein [Desulfobacterales bacterium]